MKTQIILSGIQFARSGKLHRMGVLIIAATMVMSQLGLASGSVLAAGPDVVTLFELAQSGQGDVALSQVVTYAEQVGGWTAAPGDKLVFDPYMSRRIRGSSLDYDELPDCANPKVAMEEAACVDQFRALEQQVRFGPSLFSTPSENGALEVRPSLDDLLSTYVEEVGHSWQEYLYETNGAGSGARSRQTSKAESDRWAAGREYQIKRYVLSLDGTLLNLAGAQRDMLRVQICEGYANPLGHEVPAYSAPAGWPNPQGWPTTSPSLDEFQVFCAGA